MAGGVRQSALEYRQTRLEDRQAGVEDRLTQAVERQDIDDPRASPAFELIERLLHLGAEVSYHDPHIPTAPHMRSWPHLPPMTSLRACHLRSLSFGGQGCGVTLR